MIVCYNVTDTYNTVLLYYVELLYISASLVILHLFHIKVMVYVDFGN